MEMQEDFSIREYASKMRNLDVEKCWPFDAERSFLPPITVKKFSWWLDEVEYFLRPKLTIHVENSNKKEMEAEENGELVALDDSDIDVELVKLMPLKVKAKAPKKRSILEIFAVAPLADEIISSGYKEVNWGLKRKRNEKKKIEKKKNKEIITLGKLKERKNVIDKIKKMDLSFPNKVLHHGESDNDICHGVSIRKRKERLQDKIPTISFLEEAINENDCGKMKSNKQVTFSDKEPILEMTKIPSPSVEDLKFYGLHEKISPAGLYEDTFKSEEPNYQVYGIPSGFSRMANSSRFSPTSFNNYSKPSDEPLVLNLENRSNRMSHVSADNLFSQSFPLCSLPVGNQRRNVCEKRSINENVFGLRLNSQGELIKSNSSAEMDFNHTMKFADPSFSSMDKLNLFPVTPSRSEFTELKLSIDSDLIKLNSFYSEKSMCKEDNRVGEHKIRSTMRLMGKEFTVGGNDFQEFDDRNLWKDKQMIKNSTTQPSLGKLRETLVGSESTYYLPRFQGETNLMNPRKFDHVRELYPTPTPVTSSTFHNPRSCIRFPFMHPDFEGHVPLCFDGRPSSYCTSSFPRQCSLVMSESSSLKPDTIWLHNSFASGSIVTPSILTHHALLPAYPVTELISVEKKRHGRIGERIKSRRSNSVLDHSKKLKSPCFSASKVPSTIPSYAFQEGEGAYYPWTNSVNGVPVSGSVGLTAGTKHILKACDQEKDRSGLKSNNPFGETIMGLRFMEPENPTNIFRF